MKPGYRDWELLRIVPTKLMTAKDSYILAFCKQIRIRLFSTRFFFLYNVKIAKAAETFLRAVGTLKQPNL
jgi:hypothetical protein